MPTPFRIRAEGPGIPTLLDLEKLEADRHLIEGWHYGKRLEEMEGQHYGAAYMFHAIDQHALWGLTYAERGDWLRAKYGLDTEGAVISTAPSSDSRG
jgi:hypothetical protein